MPAKSLGPKKNPEKKSKPEIKTPNQQLSKPQIHRLDATDKILGRLSTLIADLLRGKNKVDFTNYKLNGDVVIVYNARKIKVTGNKLTDKIYYHHTGYIGHLKSFSMADLMREDPSEIIRRSVFGMLPKNRLRKTWMKNLKIYNDEIKNTGVANG